MQENDQSIRLRPATARQANGILLRSARVCQGFRDFLTTDGEKPFAARGRVSHAFEVQIGDVAHIDRAEREIRAAW